MLLYESEFVKIVFDEENLVVENHRRDCSEMSDENYRTEAIILAEFVEKHKPKGILMNNREFNFVIVPSTQIWVNQNIFPRLLKTGLRKGAFVVTDNVFSQVSVEQTLDEEESKPFIIKYFKNIEEAKNWLTR